MSTFNLYDLAKGDEVAYYKWQSLTTYVVFSTVERTTATQIVLADGKRFRIATGREVGIGYNPYRLTDPAGEVAVKYLVADALRNLLRDLELIDKATRSGPHTPHDVLLLLEQLDKLIGKYRAQVIAIEGKATP